MFNLNKIESIADPYLNSLRSRTVCLVEEGQERLSALTTTTRDLGDRIFFVSEPIRKQVQSSLSRPAATLRHPLDSTRGLIDAASVTFDRIKEAAAELLEQLRTGRRGDAAEDSDASLPERGEQAYRSSIDAAITQSIKHAKDATSPNSGLHDELQELPGVGPATLRKLHQAGIYRFRQIAEPSNSERVALRRLGGDGQLEAWMTEARKRL